MTALTPPTGPPTEPRSTQVASTGAPTGRFDRPSRLKIARRAPFDRLSRLKWLEKRSEERFRSILGRFGVLWGIDFRVFPMLLRTSRPTRAKKRRHRKNLIKTKVFNRFFACPCRTVLARTLRKSTENCYEPASGPSRATNRLRKPLDRALKPRNGNPRALWGLSRRS